MEWLSGNRPVGTLVSVRHVGLLDRTAQADETRGKGRRGMGDGTGGMRWDGMGEMQEKDFWPIHACNFGS